MTDLTANQELQGTRKELLAQLVTLVGLTYEQFTRTVLLAQNDFATFLKSRESAKAELLEKLTGTEIYSRISSEIYLRSKTADAELNQLKSNATLIELLSEEEITLLRTEKESLTNLREQGSKALIDLNAQLSVLHTLKLQQEQRDKKVQDMRLDEEKVRSSGKNIHASPTLSFASGDSVKLCNPILAGHVNWMFRSNHWSANLSR